MQIYFVNIICTHICSNHNMNVTVQMLSGYILKGKVFYFKMEISIWKSFSRMKGQKIEGKERLRVKTSADLFYIFLSPWCVSKSLIWFLLKLFYVLNCEFRNCKLLFLLTYSFRELILSLDLIVSIALH